MQFDNAAFERGVAQTVASMDRLTKSLNMAGSVKGLQNIGATANAQTSSLKNMEAGVNSVASRFSALQQIATGALHNIGARVSEAAIRMGKSLTLEPIIDGFREYETNLNSIQTILANTQAAGTNLEDVNGALKELNHYSDQTIYNFSEMAKNIGTFTAAGVDLETSTASIKGIANLAALSGSNSEQASGAMYQLSQAISAGRVSLEDWNSVVNAGMGGTVFQRALAQNAEKMGTLSKGAVDLKGKMKNVTIEGKSFRESITAKPGQESWLTSEVLTQTLSQFTGDLSDADLAAQGFNKSQIKAIQAQAKTARDAATQVKTLTQLFDTTKESLTSGWSQTFETIFGDFTEAKGLFTGASEAIGGIVSSSSDARNKMLSDWKELGGRDALIKGISNAFQALFSILKPIRDAFRDIFPASTGKQLYEMTVSFRDFMERLKLGSQTAQNLRRTFAGFFAILGIGWEIVKQVATTIFGLFGVVGDGSGKFLTTTASIGDFFVAMHKAIKEGEGLTSFFKGLGKVISVPIKLIQKLAGYVADVFEAMNAAAGGKQVGELADNLEPAATMGERVLAAWETVAEVLDTVFNFAKRLGEGIKGYITDFSSGLGEALNDLNLQDVFSGINTGLFAGLLLLLRSFINGGAGGNGILGGISDAIEGFTKTLGTMQNTLRAATLLQIAIAVGILAVAMNTLSKIDAEGLTRGGVAIGALFTELITAMLIFEKFSGFAGFAKMPFIMASMILMATAINILATAMGKLAALNWEELAKGLTGVLGLMVLILGFIKLMPNTKGLITTSLAMITFAKALDNLAGTLTELAALSWEEMARGLVGVGALLGAMVIFTQFVKINKGARAQALGIVLIAVAIKMMAEALKMYVAFDWEEIGRGLVAIGASLALIAGVLNVVPPTAIGSAAGVLIVAISLGLIAKALGQLGKMSWGEIGKSITALLGALTLIAAALYVIPPTAPLGAAGVLIVAISLGMIAQTLQKFSEFSWGEIAKAMVLLAGTLGIIAGALLLMPAALPGAAALLVVSAALAILGPILIAFGNMSFGQILASLVLLAGAFTVLGVAASLLTPLIPSLLGVGIAIGILGAGVALAGAGMFLFATGFTLLAGSAVAGTAAIITIVSGLTGLMPIMAKNLALALLAFAEAIGTGGPSITRALVALLNALLNAIRTMTPKIVDTLLKMLSMMLSKMLQYMPKIADTGLKLLVGLLTAIANNIGKVADTATKVIVAWIQALGRNLPKIIDAGVKFIIAFVNGLAKAIRDNEAKMHAAGRNLAGAIVEGMIGGIKAGLGAIKDAAGSVASAALDAAKSVLGINSPSKEFEKLGKFVNDGFRKGLDGNKKQVYDAFGSLKAMLKDTQKSATEDIHKLEDRLKRLSKASHKNWSEINKTKKALTQARREFNLSGAAYAELIKKWTDDRNRIGTLANQFDVLSEKIKKADEAYKNAVKTRDDYRKQVTDQYSDMASPTGDISVADYIKNLAKQVEDTKVFSNQLQRLRKLGLSDEMYKDLLSQGVSALPFVEELLKGGRADIDAINKLGKELDQAGAALGKTASANLYQAAVNSAKGFVDGLKKQQAAIEKQMDKIADAMVRAIKKKLKIKSPSRVFMELGGFVAKGLALGVTGSSNVVAKSAEDVGQTAVDSVRKSISGFSDLITADLDSRPTITPVLDLTNFRKDSAQLGRMLPTQGISVDAAYAKAQYVRDAYASAQSEATQADLSSQGSTVSYTQNNYSPKALSAAEIYRQTNNQLSTVKGALSTSAK